MMASLDKVTSGQGIFPISATTWNSFIDAAKLAKMRGDARGLNALSAGRENSALTVLVKNNSGVAVEALGVLAIGDPIITATANEDEFKQRIGFIADTPATSDFGKFVITAESIPAGEIGLAYAEGIVPVLCQVDYTQQNRADISNGTDNKLLANWHGSAQILWKESGTGAEKWAVVKLGQHDNVRLAGTADSGITFNSYGPVTISDKGTPVTGATVDAYLDWLHGDQSISAGKEVIIEWFPFERRWRVTNAECE